MDKAKQKEISGKASKEQVEAWEKEYGVVHEIIVDDKAAYLKKFSRTALSLAMTFLRTDFPKFGETMAVNHWLGGDKEIYEDAEYVLSFSEQISVIVQVKNVDYVKHSAKQPRD